MQRGTVWYESLGNIERMHRLDGKIWWVWIFGDLVIVARDRDVWIKVLSVGGDFACVMSRCGELDMGELWGLGIGNGRDGRAVL